MSQRNIPPSVLLRLILIIWGIELLVFTYGFATQAVWAVWLWPWSDGPLSYLFVGSILAAIGLPSIWIGWSGEFAAMRPGALDLTLTYAGITGSLLWFAWSGPEIQLRPYILIAAISIFLNLLVYLAQRGVAWRDQLATPWLVRISFLVFFILLIAVGTALLMRLPHVFPWPLKPETSLLIGWIFYGAAVYFLHGLWFPYWGNACGQLLGFLAYDIVLLGPFIRHWQKVPDAHRLSLTVYLLVLVYSLVIACYFLFLHPRTRLWRRRSS